MARRIYQSIFLLVAWLGAGLDAKGSDACSTRAIVAWADVSVSDGTSFQIESWYQAPNVAAIRHIDRSLIVTAVEGPLGWLSVDGAAQLGDRTNQHFALGHQFHALLLHFADIIDNVRSNNAISFAGQSRRGLSGDFPYGGRAHLIDGETENRPAGVVLEISDELSIESTFHDWRKSAHGMLPHHVRIFDGRLTFDYRFTTIDLSERPPLWFHDAVPEPEIDEVQVYRLHRSLLVAHCMADAEMMATLSAPEIVVASRGELLTTNPDETRTRFSELFERIRYTAYVDMKEPIIEVAESGDLAWIAVNVRAAGHGIESETPFDDRWAWVMMTKKIDGRWRHAGNASNVASRE